MANHLEYEGYCPICEKRTVFVSANGWYRDFLQCTTCVNGSVPRERALALILNEQAPHWRDLRIHESSPVPRGISLKLERECPKYVKTQYFPEAQFGTLVNGVRNENLEALTFPDEALDVTITLDVMEHVYRPDLVLSEVWRTLAPGGVYICTFPVRKAQVAGWERRFELMPDGSRHDIREPEFHGNPVSAEGSIVTVDYGYDLHQALASWAPFDVRVYRFADRTHGILGEYTEVIVARRH